MMIDNPYMPGQPAWTLTMWTSDTTNAVAPLTVGAAGIQAMPYPHHPGLPWGGMLGIQAMPDPDPAAALGQAPPPRSTWFRLGWWQRVKARWWRLWNPTQMAF